MEGTELESKMESEKGFNSKTVTIMVITAIIIGAAALSLGIVGTVHNDVNKVSGSTNITITGSQNDPTVNLKTALTEITSINSTAGLSLGASTDSNFSVTGADQDLTLKVSGGGTQKLFLNSAGTGTDAIDINATGGGIDIDASGAVSIESTTGSITMGDALADEQTLTLGNTSSIAMILIPSATPADEKIVLANYHGTAFNSISIFSNNGGIDISGSTGISMNSGLGGDINIGDDTVAQNINIGTGAAVRTITMGNVTGATALVLNSGTGGISLASTGAGNITIDSDNTLILDADGILELNSSTGAINIGNDDIDQAINIGTQGERTVSISTGAFASTVNIGNATGATSVSITSGTGGITLTGAVTFATGAQSGTVAMTAQNDHTDPGALIAAGSSFVIVTSTTATYKILLPTPVVGNVIWLYVGANGFQLRTGTDTTSIGINGGGTGINKGSAISATTLVRMVCTSSTTWIGTQFSSDGTESKVPIPS